MFTTYILFSESISRYYTGYTALPLEERIKKHLSKHSGFTGKAKDWKCVFSNSFHSLSGAEALISVSPDTSG